MNIFVSDHNLVASGWIFMHYASIEREFNADSGNVMRWGLRLHLPARSLWKLIWSASGTEKNGFQLELMVHNVVASGWIFMHYASIGREFECRFRKCNALGPRTSFDPRRMHSIQRAPPGKRKKSKKKLMIIFVSDHNLVASGWIFMHYASIEREFNADTGNLTRWELRFHLPPGGLWKLIWSASGTEKNGFQLQLMVHNVVASGWIFMHYASIGREFNADSGNVMRWGLGLHLPPGECIEFKGPHLGNQKNRKKFNDHFWKWS